MQQPMRRAAVNLTLPQSSGISLAPDVLQTIPAAEHLQRLQGVERRLDATIARKRFDLQDSLNRPQKVKKVLRVWCSNTCHDQAWQAMDDGMGMELNHFDFENVAIPGWTLRLEGKLIGITGDMTSSKLDSGPVRIPHFTDLLRSVVIEPAAGSEDAYTDGPLFEWHKSSPAPGYSAASSYPGIEIKRKGDIDLDLKIMLTLDHLPEKYKLQTKLSALLDINVDTRPGIITALWHYVRLHKLQDPDERRLIQCDASLQEIFGTERIFFPKVPELLTKYLEPVDPITIEYHVRTDKELHYADPWDIEVELDDPMRLQMAAALTSAAPASASSLHALDDELASLAVAIEHSASKREFMSSFSETPNEFLQDWIEGQDEDLSIILGEVKSVNGEHARRAKFYQHAESRQWLQECVFKYLAAQMSG